MKVQPVTKLTMTVAVLGLWILAGCGSTPKNVASTDVAPTAAAAPTSGLRDIASAREVEALETQFQSIATGASPELQLRNHIDELYHLLIETNKGIDQFEKELDAQLAQKKTDPHYVVREPLSSPTYTRLLKLWNLRQQYLTESGYFYYRLLSLSVERGENGRPTAQSMSARQIRKGLETHLQTTQDSRRVELQILMAHLRDVYDAFIAEAKARPRSKGAAAPEIVPNGQRDGEASVSLANEPSFAAALFQSPEELNTYVTRRKIRTVPRLKPSELKIRQNFMKNVESRLDALPEPDRDERTPQSVQDTTCKAGKRLCAGTDETGNIVGFIFPAGVWAFTFDDGPVARSTNDMMELVHDYHDVVNPIGKATFFQLAQNARTYPQWIKKGFDYGFALENHSFTHADLHNPNTNRHHEIIDANDVLTTEYRKVDPNYVIQYYRCPYGSCYAPRIPEVRQMIADQKQIHVYWRIDSLDWKLLNGAKVADLVEKQIQLLDHGVILMHDIHATTVDAMRLILPWLKNQNDNLHRNYKMVTIPEAVDLVNGPAKD